MGEWGRGRRIAESRTKANGRRGGCSMRLRTMTMKGRWARERGDNIASEATGSGRVDVGDRVSVGQYPPESVVFAINSTAHLTPEILSGQHKVL